MGLLSGVRVLESAQLFNGDTLGALLGDLGADVIKIESPFRGDYLRDMLGQIAPHNSPAHMQINKNKRSVALDLRKDAGREVFWKLLATADVFVDGNAADAMTKLGVGYEAQRARRPAIVYCQYSGYGATGPYATIPTHGQMMNAAAGGTPMEMGEDGLVHPYRGRQSFNGIASGGEGTAAGATFAAYHVAAALFQRERSGEGCYIDVSGSEAVISSAWIAATYILNDERVVDRRSLPAPQDPAGTSSAKYQFYRTLDKRYVLFCCIEPKFWANFCKLAERPDLIGESDSGPVDFAVSGDPSQTLRREIQKIIESRTQAEWTRLAAEHDLAIGPALQEDELRSDVQLSARGAFIDAVHPVAGPFTHVTLPALVNGKRSTEIRHHAPALGEQTAEILGEIGLTDNEIGVLRDAGVIGTT
ncbi:CaiB/BaiF CoA transferase family protein [Mycobacterium paraseoulense]|uniref:CoA transferase n=1 Tax=Mycobacterium paraseoulense TaxID=590652 RepID=A0A1X0IF82_9MYCO|nr:CaiB/BaiF CoA-transferase family protein [Mycobacterium paraseoulense]MCV7393735.1 CoA transferase [Mycobacterium paraseoulense]ORB45520.1 CoA transferase [Mycobacterium paraseoulense]BBZ70647.1 CoA transferase [Mycobacterium paraseoulense]